MKELQQIQTALKAPKGQYNSFGKYAYRSCEDICEAVKPLLAQTGCTQVLTDEIVMVGDFLFVKATATVENASGETRSATGFAMHPLDKKGQDPSQMTGAASSYARKYALNGLYCIDDNKDADFTNTHGKGAETQNQPLLKPKAQSVLTPKQRFISGDQRVELFNAGKNKGLSTEEMSFIVFDVCGAEKSALVPASKFQEVLDALNNAEAGKVM